MTYLIIIFSVISILGFILNHVGAGILAFTFAGLSMYARGWFDKQDTEWEESPSAAKSPPDTDAALADKECEASGSKL